MRLIKATALNKKYFDKGSRPSVRQWADWIENGLVYGKVLSCPQLIVFVDEDDFLQKDRFSCDPDSPSITEAALKLLE